MGHAIPRVHTVFHTVKLDEQSVERVPAFRGNAFKAIDAPREKFLVRLYDVAPDRIASDFPVHAILALPCDRGAWKPHCALDFGAWV